MVNGQRSVTVVANKYGGGNIQQFRYYTSINYMQENHKIGLLQIISRYTIHSLPKIDDKN